MISFSNASQRIASFAVPHNAPSFEASRLLPSLIIQATTRKPLTIHNPSRSRVTNTELRRVTSFAFPDNPGRNAKAAHHSQPITIAR